MTPVAEPIKVNPEYVLTFSIQSTGGRWLIVGATCHDWLTREQHPDLGQTSSLDIHFDADDPTFTFEEPNDWPELPASVIIAYNAPYRRTQRLALRRATSTAVWDAIMPAHYEAAARIAVAKARRLEDGDIAIQEGGFVRHAWDDDALPDYIADLGPAGTAFIAASDLIRARAERRFTHADIARAAIYRAGFNVAIHQDDAVEYWGKG